MPQYSRYEVLQSFTKSLANSFRELGVRVSILEGNKDGFKLLYHEVTHDPPDCTLTFNALLPDQEGRFLSDMLQIPHVSCLVDPPFYFLELLKGRYNIITCVDRFGVDFLKSVHFTHSLFLPHAVDKKLVETSPAPRSERPFDVVMLGSFTNLDAIKNQWIIRYGKAFADLLEETAHRSLSNLDLSHAQILAQATQHVDTRSVNFIELAIDIERYLKGLDRIELLRHIKDVRVDLFGGPHEKATWSEFLGSDHPNIIVHEEVGYIKALEIMQKSKIVLNTSAFFKYGAHERIFNGIACGAAVLTNQNDYLASQFTHEEDILFYRPPGTHEVNDYLVEYLKDDQKREELVQRGREKVLQAHTWDHRAAFLYDQLEPMIEEIVTLQ